MRFKMATFQDGQLVNIVMDHQIQWAATTAHHITELTTKLVACKNGLKLTIQSTAITLEFVVVGTLLIRMLISQLMHVRMH